MPLHAPGYNYCGPGTWDMTKKPVNALDKLCKVHDQYYTDNPNESRFFGWNAGDEKFLRGIYRLESKGLTGRFIEGIFSAKRYLFAKKNMYEKRTGKKRTRSKTPFKPYGRKRKRFGRRKRKFLRKKFKIRKPKRKPKVPVFKRLLRSNWGQARQRIERGNVPLSEQNQCTWTVMTGCDHNQINTKLANLEVYDTATDARKTLTNLHNDVNFNAYVTRNSVLKIMNNQETDENYTMGENPALPQCNIEVHVYYVTPKYFKTSLFPLVDLQQAFVSNGLSADLTEIDKYMYNAPYFKRLWNVSFHGKFNMNPGEKRTLIHKHQPKWWRRYKDQLLGDDYRREWNGYWLIRQQGEIVMNAVSDADNAKPFYCATRLTMMTTENHSIFYPQQVGKLKDYDFTRSSTVDTTNTAMPLACNATEVDDELDQKEIYDRGGY